MVASCRSDTMKQMSVFPWVSIGEASQQGNWFVFGPGSTSKCTSSQCFGSSSCRSALSSVKCPCGFFFAFFFLRSEQHFALAYRACFLRVLLLIFAVHFAAASSRNQIRRYLVYSLFVFPRCFRSVSYFPGRAFDVLLHS